MAELGAAPAAIPAPPVYVVSGGTGSSGEVLVHTAVAQFVGCCVPVVLVPRVRTREQLEEVVAKAAADGGTVVHTLVDGRLRGALARLGRARHVPTVDLMGPLLTHLARTTGKPPVGQPGLYRQLSAAYFHRVAAIDFAMKHDDGLRPEDLPEADVVLLGVSRVGKTPVTMYLAVLGWRVANVPVLEGVELPGELKEVDRRRVIGLAIDPEQLVKHRRARERPNRRTLPSEYTDLRRVHAEVEYAAQLFRRHGYAVIDVAQKPIETTADEVIDLVGAGSPR